MKTFLKFIAVIVSLCSLAGVFIYGIIFLISKDLPKIENLSDYNPPISSKIVSKEGELLMELISENREIVDLKNVPPIIIHAFLSAEDDKFYEHHGIDYLGILRATLKNLQSGKVVQGASTITQQVAKSLLLSSERTFTRKIKDLLLAKKIEDALSKEEILYLYINQVYLGGGYYGIKSAAKGYFGKKLTEVTPAEAALVAGLLVAPGKYSPYVNPKHAKTRQKYVLKRMFETGKLSQKEYEKALEENIKLKTKQYNEIKAGHFSDWLRQRLIEQFGKENLYNSGYKIVTTIDYELQLKAEEELSLGILELDKRQGYKGPLGRVEDNELGSYLENQRKKLLEDESKYFILTKDGERKDEFTYEEGKVSKTFDDLQISPSMKKYFEEGVYSENKDYTLLSENKFYEAVVTKVNDLGRIVYATHAGLKLMIPYEGFRWAHERYIGEESRFFPFVTRPSSILKVGDKIHVKILQKTPKFSWPHLYIDFKNTIKDENFLNILKKEKYILASLEQEPEVEGALLSMSPVSGEILSFVGGYNFLKSQFNRILQSNRQPGSAFKPFIYASGLENGYTASSILLDSPQALGGVDENLSWKPRNYEGNFEGEVTYRKALSHSKNVPTIKLSQDIGVEKLISFVDRMNIKTKLPRDLSISLGSFGVNLLDLVKAYAIFPNGGKLIQGKSILKIEDNKGNKIDFKDPFNEDLPQIVPPEVGTNSEDASKNQNPYTSNLKGTQVYDSRLAYIMTNLLKGVIDNGTGKGARSVGSFIGGKTGTTNNYVDAWFLGFSSRLVTGVWTGFDDNKTMGFAETGARSALPIWKGFMQLGVKKYGENDFKMPSGVINVAINEQTGKLSSNRKGKIIMEAFVEGTEPGAKQQNVDDVTQDLGEAILEDDDYYISQ